MDIDVPVQVNVGDFTDFAADNEVFEFAVYGVVTIVESADDFAF